jgi:redox-sensing transcriptional repressor
MPVYLRCLRVLQKAEVEWVSCTYLAERLQKDATLVRKDLELTGLAGKPKVGFHVPGLIGAIERFIGWDNLEDAFLAGVGNLGSALLGYEGFAQHGLHIVAGFDVDPRKVGTEIHGKDVLHVDRLPEMARRLHIGIGIVTVGARAAQAVADLMLAGGIRAIWNFAPVRLEVPAGVIVENEDLAGTLAVISRRLGARSPVDPHSA